ncbi:sigma-70 family RNA polymerase sigma factor [Sphingobacterium kitahiroshimense]|uniref:Sigma-70 family RNA polymerase sigma factor n=1 Tax=Sphingobacterium kitahiroshimense TaxID=470446 RepID=A0ABV0BP82_9SPHI
MSTIKEADDVMINWVQQYSDHLYSWALYKTSSKETAEDLVQETFLAAVKSFNNFKGNSNPKTWLCAILNHKINDYYRKSYQTPLANNNAIFDQFFDHTGHWKQDEEPQQWPDTDGSLLDDSDFQQQLQHCIKRLPPNWSAAIHLKFIDEKKGNEICQELGLTNTNFWQILHRAKLQLRKCLEINWFKN